MCVCVNICIKHKTATKTIRLCGEAGIDIEFFFFNLLTIHTEWMFENPNL